MPAGDSWLSLKVSERVTHPHGVSRPGTFISVPKKAVPLATRRNRLKRLIREAVRKDDYFADTQRVYYFRVHRWPGDLGLVDVKQKIEGIK